MDLTKPRIFIIAFSQFKPGSSSFSPVKQTPPAAGSPQSVATSGGAFSPSPGRSEGHTRFKTVVISNTGGDRSGATTNTQAMFDSITPDLSVNDALGSLNLGSTKK